MSKEKHNFDPSGYAVHNDNFIGLPFDADSANIILLPVPWEATVSYRAGTANAPANILQASYQLDLYDWDYPDAWTFGIYMQTMDNSIQTLSQESRQLALKHIAFLENELPVNPDYLATVNQNSQRLNQWVYQQTQAHIQHNKIVGLVGGDHSIPYGHIQALSEQHDSFGILQIDAHCDLRQAYEDFTYSHASIFYNILEKFSAVQKLVQVGIRDVCQDEIDYIEAAKERVKMFSMPHIRQQQYTQAQSYHQICQNIVEQLPQKVYISFDIDGLDPKLCPNTGTPVADGLEMLETFYLINQIVKSGRQIIGFDLCEVGAATEWDGNVGARILYKLSNAAYASQK